MDTSPTAGMLSELRVLLAETISLVQRVTGDHNVWDMPMANSVAGRELAAEEARCPAPQTGAWPWLLASVIASWALQAAAEEARGFLAALDQETTSCSADVLCRGILEASSLAWWLLDPGIDAQARLARSLVYRLHSASETRRAIGALELEPGDAPADYGELPQDVRQDIESAGLACGSRDCGGRAVLFCDDQPLPSYSERAASLVAKIWPQRKLPYAVLSAVTHGEILGLQRNLARTPQGLHVAPGPATELWLWHDTYLVIGALALTADRAVSFLGLADLLADQRDWMPELHQRLAALRPSAD